MDPITTAILALLPALASETLKSAVKDAYEGVKAVIRRKWGEASPLAKAVQDLEAKPQSQGRAETLKEEIAATKASEDPELMQQVSRLVEVLKTEGIGGQAVAGIKIHISGGTVQGVVGAQRVEVGAMSFRAAPTQNKS